MSDTNYKKWLDMFKDTPKEEILKYHYNLLFKVDKQKEILDKIKEIINHYAIENEDYSKIYNQEEQEILELLEEIE